MSEANPGYVYVLAVHGGSTKVGRSHSPERRRRTLVTMGGYTNHDWWVSTPLHEDAELEKLVHRHLASHRVVGEWFSCDFETAVKAVEEHRGKFGGFCEERAKAELDRKAEMSKDLIDAMSRAFCWGERKQASLDGIDLTPQAIMGIAVWSYWQKSPATDEEREEGAEFLDHILGLSGMARSNADDWIEEVRMKGASMMAHAVAVGIASSIPSKRMYTY